MFVWIQSPFCGVNAADNTQLQGAARGPLSVGATHRVRYLKQRDNKSFTFFLTGSAPAGPWTALEVPGGLGSVG